MPILRLAKPPTQCQQYTHHHANRQRHRLGQIGQPPGRAGAKCTTAIRQPVRRHRLAQREGHQTSDQQVRSHVSRHPAGKSQRQHSGSHQLVEQPQPRRTNQKQAAVKKHHAGNQHHQFASEQRLHTQPQKRHHQPTQHRPPVAVHGELKIPTRPILGDAHIRDGVGVESR